MSDHQNKDKNPCEKNEHVEIDTNGDHTDGDHVSGNHISDDRPDVDKGGSADPEDEWVSEDETKDDSATEKSVDEISNEYSTTSSEYTTSDDSSDSSDSETYNGPEVQFEKGIIPLYGTYDSAGFDIESAQDVVLKAHEPVSVLTNLKVAYVTPGYYIAVKGRSGNAMKKNVWVFEGTIDSDYRGIIHVQLCNMKKGTVVKFKKGDRIAQGVVMPHATVFPAREQERGEGGFGSTGQ